MPTSPLETRMNRMAKGSGAARIQELQESARRLGKEGTVNSLPRWAKAIHDRTRLTMLAVMNLAGELTTTELQAVMRLSQPNVSRHLATLKKSGIITGTTRRRPPQQKRERREWSLGIGSPLRANSSEETRKAEGEGEPLKGEGSKSDGRRTLYSVKPTTARLLP